MSEPEYKDDPLVRDADPLWRKIAPCFWVPDDDNPPARRLSSSAFQDSGSSFGRSPMSVTLGSPAAAAGVTPERILAQDEKYAECGMVSIPAVAARKLGFRIHPEPDLNMPQMLEYPFHALVAGKGKKSQAERDKLLAAAVWLVRMPEKE